MFSAQNAFDCFVFINQYWSAECAPLQTETKTLHCFGSTYFPLSSSGYIDLMKAGASSEPSCYFKTLSFSGPLLLWLMRPSCPLGMTGKWRLLQEMLPEHLPHCHFTMYICLKNPFSLSFMLWIGFPPYVERFLLLSCDHPALHLKSWSAICRRLDKGPVVGVQLHTTTALFVIQEDSFFSFTHFGRLEKSIGFAGIFSIYENFVVEHF